MSSNPKRMIPIVMVGLLAFAACDASPTSPTDGNTQYPYDVIPDGGDIPRPPGSVWTSRVSIEGSGPEHAMPALRSGWSRADVLTFADPTHQVGESLIKRGENIVSFRLTARELDRLEAATLWAVVFNNPGACVGDCDDPDIFENPSTRADMLYVGGAVSNEMGLVTYSGEIREGDAGQSIMSLFGLPAWGVLDSREAEIHLVVRSHGPVIRGLREAQTRTFNGGCTGLGSEFGTPGPNECVDLYFASHYPN